MNPQRLSNTHLISPERQRRVEEARRWRSGLVIGLLLALPATAHAQGELNKPYDLQIVVHVARNRLLTDVFRERIERELHDGFQAGLGDMGRVTVTHEHPRLADVLTRGLMRSLDSWNERSDRKTHFVLIDFSGVHYEIQTRQYDGATARPSPVLRRDRTRDRDFVAKKAALLLKQDFGILGTVLSAEDGAQPKVKVELRGGGLGDLARWVKKDDVFALAPPGGGTTLALKWSLLQVEEPPAEDSRDGVCVCRFFHRYRLPNIAGYRCIKLGTVRTALRMRWMQETKDHRTKLLEPTLTMQIRRHGFQGEDDSLLTKSTGLGGVVTTTADGEKGVFENVAFVSVVGGGMRPPLPQVPIALVDDQPILVEVNAARDNDTLFTVRKEAWRSDVAESRLVQINLFKRLAVLGAKADERGQVIREAERALKRSKQDRVSLMAQRTDLLKDAKASNIKLDISREDRRLAEIEEGERELAQFIAKQKEIEASENDPQRKKWLSEIGQAKLLEKDLEYGKALAIYENIQKEGFSDAELDKHLKEVRQLWKPSADAEHEDARKFIYRVWPTLDTASLEDGIPKARKAFEKCRKAGDGVSIRKLFKGFEGHADRLVKEASELRPEINIDDVKPAERLNKVKSALLKLGQDVQEYLQKS